MMMPKKLLLIIGAVGVLAGCASTTPESEQTAAPVEDHGARTMPPSSVTTVQAQEPSGSPLDAVKDPKSILSKRNVYFDFDSFVIKDEYKSLMDAHGQFLAAHPSVKILIQGNADERGSREYNLALGQKRADAVKKALTLLGATEAQVESVSLGEEKPWCETQTEECWAQNRRGDILYQGEY